jgi:hypothetical protein
LPVQVLIFIFTLAALLLSGLSGLLSRLASLVLLLPRLITMLARLSTLLTELSALLLVLLHIVCHKIPPLGAQTWRTQLFLTSFNLVAIR